MKKVTAQHAAHAEKVNPTPNAKLQSKLAVKVDFADSHSHPVKVAADDVKKKEEAQSAAKKDHQEGKAQVASQHATGHDMGSAADSSFASMLSDASAIDASDDKSAGKDSDRGGGHISPYLIAGIAAAAIGGGIAAATSGGSRPTPTPTPTPTPANVAPVFAAPAVAASTAEDTKFSGSVTATDANVGDKLTYAIGTAATKGTAAVNADGTYTYTPNADFNGTDSFTVTAKDTAGLSASQTVNLTITAVNDAPVFAAATLAATVTEDVLFSGKAVATDVDIATNGDKLTYSLGTAPTKGTVNVAADGTYTYLTSKDSNAADSFTIKVTDSAGASAIQTVNVTVTPVNDAPAFSASSVIATLNEDTSFVGVPVATDVDTGDKLTFSIGTAAANGIVSLATDGSGKYTYTPNLNYNGPDSFVLKVTDSANPALSATQTVSFSVTPVNDAPTFAAATVAQTVTEDVLFSGKATATDVDAGDKLTYSLGTAATKGMATVAQDGTFTYLTAKDSNAADSFTVKVTDSAGASTIQTITIGVTPVNDAPTFAATTKTFLGTEDVPLTGAVTATDVDSTTLTYTLGATNFVNSGSKVTVNSDGTFTYTGVKDFNTNSGTDSFTVIVSDGVLTSTQTVTVPLTPVGETVAIDAGAVGAVASFDAKNDTLGQPDNFTFTDNTAKFSNAVLTNFSKGDVVQVSGSASQYSFTSTANDIRITSADPTTGVTNTIVLQGVLQQAGSNPAVFVTNQATAEQAAGFTFFTALTASPASTTVNLDQDNDGNINTVFPIAAGSGPEVFTENAGLPNSVSITGFNEAQDVISVSGAALSAYSFTAVGNDIRITTNNNGTSSSITLLGVLPAGFTGLISSEASAEAALGTGGIPANFFQLAGVTPPVVTPPVTSTVSLDGQGTVAAPFAYDAAGGNITYTDNATVGGGARISNFAIGDLINVTNSAGTNIAFTSRTVDNIGSGNDLVISFTTTTGIISYIEVLNVVSSAAFIFDATSARNAVGFNFITIG